MSWMLVAVIILVIFAITVLSLSRKQDEQHAEYPYAKLNGLFTPAERSFFGVLNQTVGHNALIFGKVRVADVITPQKGMTRSKWQRAFNKISGKHFDFILCDKNDLSVLCAIELNDGSHNSQRRKNRDTFLKNACNSAKLPLISIRAKKTYNINEIKNYLSDHLPEVTQLKSTTEAIITTTAPKPSKSEKLCPECSAIMVKRIAQKGKHAGNEFWACSAFPKCKHIEAITAK